VATAFLVLGLDLQLRAPVTIVGHSLGCHASVPHNDLREAALSANSPQVIR